MLEQDIASLRSKLNHRVWQLAVRLAGAIWLEEWSRWDLFDAGKWANRFLGVVIAAIVGFGVLLAAGTWLGLQGPSDDSMIETILIINIVAFAIGAAGFIGCLAWMLIKTLFVVLVTVVRWSAYRFSRGTRFVAPIYHEQSQKWVKKVARSPDRVNLLAAFVVFVGLLGIGYHQEYGLLSTFLGSGIVSLAAADFLRMTFRWIGWSV